MQRLSNPWAAIALVGIAIFTAACRCDHPTPTASSSATGTTAAASSSAKAAAKNPVQLPDWIDTSKIPQPAEPSKLLAQEIKGPLPGTVEGLLVCEIAVPSKSWDSRLPFLDSVGYADVHARLGENTVVLPEDEPRGLLVFPGMTMTKDSKWQIAVSDDDLGRDDYIGTAELNASKDFPLEFTTENMTLVCHAVPRSTLAAEIEPREAAVDRALVAMEKSAVPMDLAHPEASHKGIDDAEKALLELAAYVGFYDAHVTAAITRITAEDAKYAASYTAAVDADLAKRPRSEFQSLPSGRVRCHPSKKNAVEVEVGAQALTYNWLAKDLGAMQFRFATQRGVEVAPLNSNLFVDGKDFHDNEPLIPAHGKVEVELVEFLSTNTPHAIVVREGEKYAFVCPYAAP